MSEPIMQAPPPGQSASGKIRIVETQHIPPCPHCRQPLNIISKNRTSGAFQTDSIYSCAGCGELLSIGFTTTT